MRDATDATEKSAVAAEESAAAARDAVEATRETMRVDQRAWLGLDNIVPDPAAPEVGKDFKITVRIKNFGKTPAFNVSGSIVIDPVKQGDVPSFDYTDDKTFIFGYLPPSETASATLGPVISKSTRRLAPVTQEIVDAITSEAVRLYAHGRITYDDAFKHSHWVEFCSFLQVPFSGLFVACDEHNTSDDYPQEND